MYIIYDKKTGEYQTKEGYWYGVEDDHLIHMEANVFSTFIEADEHLDEHLSQWDKRFPVPSKDEYQIRKVRCMGWTFEEEEE